ncbi:putative lipid-transfer protein DIR1 [Cornus florida]|uniref:putative lipid-transfer protein DIR1 n=1 Tax=Cornus florida TaxID=4283 RepID=UPI00289B8D7C|nr:putative lipid-transfer protein DIR1 [Cornus florida]
MEMGRKMMVVVVMVLVMVLEGSKAFEFCNMTKAGMLACEPCVTHQPQPAKPTPECCQALSCADLACLCSYKDSFVLSKLGVDSRLAMELPPKCNLTLPKGCCK